MKNVNKPKIVLLIEHELDRKLYSAALEASFELIFLASPSAMDSSLLGTPVELIFIDYPSLAAAALPMLETVRKGLQPKSYVASLMTTDSMDAESLEDAASIDVVCTRAQAAQQLRVLVKAGLRIRATMLELLETNQKLGRVSERLKKLSLTDELTGLYNMRFMARQLRNEFKRAERYLKNLSLILIEIDGFAALSERLGEAVGSEIITQIGQELGDGIRFEIDYAARSGSADFMLALPETDINGALRVAERMRRKVEVAVFEGKNQGLQLSASVGVAHYSGPRKNLASPNDMLRIAELGIQRAKALGANRVDAPQNDPSAQLNLDKSAS